MILTIKNIEAQSANAVGGVLVAGYPALTTFAGFVNAIGDTLGFTPKRFMIGHHTFDLRASKRYEFLEVHRPLPIRGLFSDKQHLSGEDRFMASAPSVAYCDLTFDLHIDVGTDQVSMDEVESLYLLRALGGRLLRFESACLIPDAAFVDAVKRSSAPFFLKHRPDLLSSENGDAWEQMLAHMQRSYEKVKEEGRSHPRIQMGARMSGEAGWLIPSGMGYIALEESPQDRKGTRMALPHLFVEPIYGICQFIPANSIRKSVEVISELPWFFQTHTPQYFVIGDESTTSL